MGGDGAEFSIDIDVPPSGAESAAAQVTRLTAALTTSGAAAIQAAEAVKAGEAAYRLAETGADRAAKAVEKIGLAADAQRGKVAAALAVGDTAGVERATAKMNALNARPRPRPRRHPPPPR